MSSLAGVPVDSSNINNLKDILMTYNKITEACFVRCAGNFNSRTLTTDEESCVSSCSSKLINSNQRLMAGFMEVQGKRQEALAEEAEQKYQEEMEKQQAGESDPSSDPSPDKPDKQSTMLKGVNMLFSAGQKTNTQDSSSNETNAASDTPQA